MKREIQDEKKSIGLTRITF